MWGIIALIAYYVYQQYTRNPTTQYPFYCILAETWDFLDWMWLSLFQASFFELPYIIHVENGSTLNIMCKQNFADLSSQIFL